MLTGTLDSYELSVNIDANVFCYNPYITTFGALYFKRQRAPRGAPEAFKKT